METIAVVLQAVLCSTLMVAVAGKIADLETSIKWIAQLGVHRPAPALVLALVVEAAVVVATAALPIAGALGGLGFIAGATVVLYIAKGKGLDCSCFGPSHRVTAWSFARNGLIAAGFLALALIHGAGSPGTVALILACAAVAPVIRAIPALRTLERVT